MTFAGVFKKVSKHLSSSFVVSGGPPEAFGNALPIPPDLHRGTVDANDFRPLLDMASQNCVDVQAEAASALASLAEDPQAANALCSEPGALEDISKLLEPDRLDVIL